MDSINTELLTADERQSIGVARRVDGWPAWRAFLLGGGTTAVVAVVASIAAEYFHAEGADADAAMQFALLANFTLAFGSLGTLIRVLVNAGRATRARDQRVTDYLREIGYEARTLAPEAGAASNTADHDDRIPAQYTWMTGNYDPERYYSYDKSTRDYMKIAGIDADTYDANVEGRER